MKMVSIIFYPGLALCAYIVYKLLDLVVRIPQIGDLGQRYFFITGCDTGFGNSIAKKLDKLGCNVFAACLTEQGEAELKRTSSIRMKTLIMDVSNHESVLNGFLLVKNTLPPRKGLSGILNNAGVGGSFGPSDWLQLPDYHQTLSVNLLGVIDVTTTFLPLVKKARGRVVNTASIFGRHSTAGTAPYAISKYGVEAFSDVLRREMRPFKVSVHLIEPGFHQTNIIDKDVLLRTLRRVWNQTPQDVKDQYGQEYLKASEDAILKTFLGAIVTKDISGVVNAYAHALTGLFPRARYVVGDDTKLIWLPVQYLPEWLGDWVMETLHRKNGAVSPAGAPK